MSQQQPPSFEQIQEQLKYDLARLELAMTRSELRLLETAWSGTGWGSIVDPFDQWRDMGDRGQWLPLGPHERKDGYNRPFVWSDFDLDVMRTQARWIATKNDLGIGALSTLTNFTVKTGFVFEAETDPNTDDPGLSEQVGKAVQREIDQFCKDNVFDARQRSIFSRSRRDGEAFVRLFGQDDGTSVVRMVEPEQVRTPPGFEGDEWSFGVHTDPDDIETVLGYWISYSGRPDIGEEVDAEEVFHLKLNVDECIKRGLSDFYSSGEALDGVNKLLRNMRESGAIQAAISWIEQYEQASRDQIQGSVLNRRDQNRTYYDHPITGREINYAKYEPGSILKVGRGKTYAPAPLAANTTQHISIVQACLRAIGARWNMPEFMISADASNNNYASVLVAGSPFVIAVECNQNVYAEYFLRILWAVIRHAATCGRIVVNGRAFSGEEISRLIDIKATPPQVAIANKAEEADIDSKDIAAGVMSKQTRREKLGLDNEVERQRIAEEPPTPPPGPGAGSSPQGGGGLFGESLRERYSSLLAKYLNLLEVKDTSGHEHGTDGRFGSGGGGGLGGSTTGKAEEIAKAGGGLGEKAKAIAGKVKDKIVAKYQKMEGRYGRKGAIAVMAACIALTPVPVPGSSFVPIGIAEGALVIHKMIKGSSMSHKEGVEDNDPAELVQAIREFLAEVYAEAGEDPPALSDEDILKALNGDEEE